MSLNTWWCCPSRPSHAIAPLCHWHMQQWSNCLIIISPYLLFLIIFLSNDNKKVQTSPPEKRLLLPNVTLLFVLFDSARCCAFTSPSVSRTSMSSSMFDFTIPRLLFALSAATVSVSASFGGRNRGIWAQQIDTPLKSKLEWISKLFHDPFACAFVYHRSNFGLYYYELHPVA